MSKNKWYRVDVNLNHPDRECEVIDIGLDADGYKEACEEALSMVVKEEGLSDEDRQYLSIGLVTEPV